MFEITGKYGTAKVYATTLEDECISQIYGFMNSPVVEGCNIAIMPDAHCGKGSSIGFTQKINGRVNPNMVGVDISCGMLVTKLDGKKVNEICNIGNILIAVTTIFLILNPSLLLQTKFQ